jgi:hypothetical protein
VTTWTLDRLSKEWVGPLAVAVDGTPVTGWTYAVLPRGARPDSADDIVGVPDATDDGLGILVGPDTGHVLEPGTYRIWVRYAAGVEAPVLAAAGLIDIT